MTPRKKVLDSEDERLPTGALRGDRTKVVCNEVHVCEHVVQDSGIQDVGTKLRP